MVWLTTLTFVECNSSCFSRRSRAGNEAEHWEHACGPGICGLVEPPLSSSILATAAAAAALLDGVGDVSEDATDDDEVSIVCWEWWWWWWWCGWCGWWLRWLWWWCALGRGGDAKLALLIRRWWSWTVSSFGIGCTVSMCSFKAYRHKDIMAKH